MHLPLRHSQAILPNPNVLWLDRIEREDLSFRLWVHVLQRPVCPVCGAPSHSRHSAYVRCLQDLPWQGASVQLWVTAHRYRCRNTWCPRKIFCERLPNIARPYARQTDRLLAIIMIVGYVAGGLPGQRLLARLAIETSDDTVLRRVKQNAPDHCVPVRNLGVDDWAWRKGQEYGTILVNLDLHRVMDLLPDRSSESFATWLNQHPGVVTVARDRCGLYAEGATVGAPQAQQVADRFHLVVNLSATVEKVLEERSRYLVLPPPEADASPVDVKTGLTSDPSAVTASPRVSASQQRRERRLARYQQVIDLYQSGYSKKAISRELGIETKTIRRWLRAGQFPERKVPHRRPPKVQAFADYLQQRWTEGCHNATRLYNEIRAKGYRGKRSMVARFVSAWRATGKPRSPNAPEKVAPKHAAILVTRRPDALSAEQQQLFDRIALQCPEVIELRRAALDFRDALGSRDSSRLQLWIERAKHSEFGPVVRFAYGLQKDIQAVRAAVDTGWSTGQVEGQINRLKMIKRQMYGRAGFTLLRARVLPLCRPEPGTALGP
jgi:transposase